MVRVRRISRRTSASVAPLRCRRVQERLPARIAFGGAGHRRVHLGRRDDDAAAHAFLVLQLVVDEAVERLVADGGQLLGA